MDKLVNVEDFSDIGGLKEDAILKDGENLAKVATLFDTHKEGLMLLLNQMLYYRGLYITRVNDAPAGERDEKQRQMEVIAEVYSEAEKYSMEFAKRKENKKANAPQETKPVAETTKPVKKA